MKCKEVAYCSRECQKNDWKSHKKVCQTKIKNCIDWLVKNVCKFENIIIKTCNEFSKKIQFQNIAFKKIQFQNPDVLRNQNLI